jgi:hypothetical protein
MEFLSRHTNVPSLRMCDWAYESEPTNTVGIRYILMQKLDGKPPKLARRNHCTETEGKTFVLS